MKYFEKIAKPFKNGELTFTVPEMIALRPDLVENKANTWSKKHYGKEFKDLDKKKASNLYDQAMAWYAINPKELLKTKRKNNETNQLLEILREE